MEIELIFHGHCIETAARRRYERSLARCLKDRDAAVAEEETELRLEGLKYFLEHGDFGYLRSHFPELNGNAPARVVLKFSERLDDPVISCGSGDIVVKQK
jgi:hypothetical protein